MDLLTAFQRFNLQTIDDYIATKRSEDLQLDFKTVNKAEMTKEDRKTLAVSISGFANSSGGLIVWGIDARKVDDVDCAQEKRPIQNIQQFISRLNDLTGSASHPDVTGVQHAHVLESGRRPCIP
ncbi:MAG: helix-turn-helix domain-containing protein [Planctomycetota bacterium]